MIIIIPTVQHTGTKFIGHLLKGDFAWDCINGPVNEKAIHVGHIAPKAMHQIMPKVKKYTTIVPLRHPYLVGESWKRKDKKEEDLIWSYETLINDIGPHVDYFLPIDIEERQDYLNAINAGLNTHYKTNWEVKNSQSKTYDLTWRDITPSSELVSFVENHQEFIERFWPT